VYSYERCKGSPTTANGNKTKFFLPLLLSLCRQNQLKSNMTEISKNHITYARFRSSFCYSTKGICYGQKQTPCAEFFLTYWQPVRFTMYFKIVEHISQDDATRHFSEPVDNSQHSIMSHRFSFRCNTLPLMPWVFSGFLPSGFPTKH
jgi:hypothetical protein